MASYKFNDLIRFTDKGIVKADFAQIVEALTNRMKEIYGYDIDLSMTSADGIKITDEATIIDKAFECIEEMYSNLNPATATGGFLDILCSLTNVYRKQATSSKVAVYVTYVGVGERKEYLGTVEKPYLKLFDKNTGKTWTINKSFYIENNMTNNSGVVVANPTLVFWAESDEKGKIELTENSLQMVELDANIQISQPNVAIIGEEEETDDDLRVRRKNFKSFNSVTVLEGLASAIASVGGVKDVKIFNNNQSTALTQRDQYGNACTHDVGSIGVNSIYVLTRYEESPKLSQSFSPINNVDLIVDDNEVGKAILDNLTAGVHTTECDVHGLDYGISKEYAPASYSDFTKPVYWKVCVPYESNSSALYFDIQIVQMNNYKGDNVELPIIAKAIGEFMNELRIGQVFNTFADITPLVMSSGMSKLGEQTYFCQADCVTFYNGQATTGNVANLGCTYYKFQGIVSGNPSRTTDPNTNLTTIRFKVI